MNIKENISSIKNNLPGHVKLVAISKTKSPEIIMQAYQAGHKILGENKVQELVEKYAKLPKDIEWHMVGHLQTNKVKYIASFIHLIHSVESLKLLLTINKEAIKHNRTIDCLLQVHIAQEETKFGLSNEELKELLNSDEFKNMTNIRVVGLMGMATFTDDMDQVRAEFRSLVNTFKEIKDIYFGGNEYFKEISMGMSDDYRIAIEEGSTIVRIGSSIFGARYCNVK
ncbi:MAG: YggS family pyridoxal phosphate-dependent enzyme [Bacteroidales bacterium]|nr:YggS family pyridoxal phosphate-dependent enzyme [Bacteroidales bacterium]